MSFYSSKLSRRRRQVNAYSIPADTVPIAEGGRYAERRPVRVIRFPVVRGMIAPGIGSIDDVRMVITAHPTKGR